MSFTTITKNGVQYLACDAVCAVHGFSTRHGGVSDGYIGSMNLSYTRGDDHDRVLENHRLFAEAVGYPMERLVSSRQVHGDTIHIADESDFGKASRSELDYESDGLMTDKPGIPLMILTADCCPVLLFDPVRKAAAAVHAGWRGTALGIAGKAVREMVREYGCKSENIIAAIGPCISKCCFETDSDVPDAMEKGLGSGAERFITQSKDKYHVDIKGINAEFLRREGVTNIHITDQCTACDTDRYFSHRKMGEKRGSLASVIMIPEVDK
ncbi:MAG: peptidoglycan editing factor PgeF [Ruminococcaceae bacterium]|nr:peptidoglycan editing factor PgeF [Oscillospiraceae bacterium]